MNSARVSNKAMMLFVAFGFLSFSFSIVFMVTSAVAYERARNSHKPFYNAIADLYSKAPISDFVVQDSETCPDGYSLMTSKFPGLRRQWTVSEGKGTSVDSETILESVDLGKINGKFICVKRSTKKFSEMQPNNDGMTLLVDF